MNRMEYRRMLEGHEEQLTWLRNAVCNAYVAYQAENDEELAEELRHYPTQEEPRIIAAQLENTMELPYSTATKILSNCQLKLNPADILEGYSEDADEAYRYYAHPRLWEQMETMDDIDFAIAVFTMVADGGGYGDLRRFYGKKIDRLIRDSGLANIYQEFGSKRSVFIAMWFDEIMQPVRGAIDKTVASCGYKPVFIDQKEHNEQIVPEIFHEIAQCEFMVADLTGHRGGVYYEAGYAHALGKQVILCCDKAEATHFDVAQVNTIYYMDKDDLARRLYKRIEACHGIQ